MNAMRTQVAAALAGLLVLAGSGRAESSTAGTQPAAGPAGRKGQPVTLRFWGHACFTITAPNGQVLLIDPFSPAKVGYHAFDVAPEIVLISHEHFDHADTSWLKGRPVVLHGLAQDGSVAPIDRRVGPFHVRAVPAQHWEDPAQKARGQVAIFVIEVAGLRIAHLSDLGRTLEPAQVQAIGAVDVLLVPVGGFYTIGAEQARQVVEQLKPKRYIVPMHFRTPTLVPTLRSQLDEPGPFLQLVGPNAVRLEDNELRIDPEAPPPEPQVVLLNHLPAPATQPK